MRLVLFLSVTCLLLNQAIYLTAEENQVTNDFLKMLALIPLFVNSQARVQKVHCLFHPLKFPFFSQNKD